MKTLASMLVSLFALHVAVQAQSTTTRPAELQQPAWTFNQRTQWGGWTANAQIRNVRFEQECVVFETAGSDPMLVSPRFEWGHATNGQHVELDMDCTAGGEGEFYFTNTTTGPYEGFDGKWFVPLAVAGKGRQVVRVCPLWETLGKVIRIRVDPPGGVVCRLYGIRIVNDEQLPAIPSWTFGSSSSWRSMFAARLEPTSSGLRVEATRPMAVIATATEPFDAARRSILRLSARCPGEHAICLYWANREAAGLWGEPVDLPKPDDGQVTLDLRQFSEWKGTITNLAIGFGTHGHEVLTLQRLSIDENDSSRPFIRLKYLGYASGVGRVGRPARVRALIEHAAGSTTPAGFATLQTDENASCPEAHAAVPAMTVGGRSDLVWTIVPRAIGRTRMNVAINGQTFERTLRVDPPAGDLAADDYGVPAPRPVASDYQIGIYYYPGWSEAGMRNWKRQVELPERDPLLGWYQEGLPQVADWHIKWAVENGISFFVYDWYWRDGHEQLGAALDDGLLGSRYADRIKFAVMWANHKPFASHTREQLATVASFWIEHYLRRPNYLTVEGKPYVSFYCPQELLECLGSPEQVREALDAMRARARAAGLPGLHIAAIDIPGQVQPPVLRLAGFDSFTAYTYARTGITPAHSLYRPYLMGYHDKWEAARRATTLPYVPAMSVGWDGPVWYGPRSERRRGRRTEDLAEGLDQLKTFLDETGGRMAILEAWNEWGEGAYLEPNVEFGFGDVEAVRKTFARPGAWPVNVGPEDVGLGGTYDMRNRASAASQPAAPR